MQYHDRLCYASSINFFSYIELISSPGFPGGLVGKESTCDAGDAEDSSLIPGSGRSPGGGQEIQYSCLENPMDKEPGGLQSIGSQGVGHD